MPTPSGYVREIHERSRGLRSVTISKRGEEDFHIDIEGASEASSMRIRIEGTKLGKFVSTVIAEGIPYELAIGYVNRITRIYEADGYHATPLMNAKSTTVGIHVT